MHRQDEYRRMTTKPIENPEFSPQFFVLRTPLLPVNELLQLSGGILPLSSMTPEALHEAIALQRAETRTRLRALATSPEIGEALYVATADFAGRVREWIDAPDPANARLELALLRYLLRMTTRATPFGLFAGCSVGTIGDTTDIALDSRSAYRRVTRFDSEYLARVRDLAVGDSTVRDELRCFPNSSLALLGGAYRYLFATTGEHGLTYDLYRVEADSHLNAVLEFAANGPLVRDIRAMLSASVEGSSEDDVADYVDELLSSQILIPDCGPAVTGDDPAQGILTPLRDIPAARDIYETCAAGLGLLQRLDNEPIGAGGNLYDATANRMASLEIKTPHQLQTDLFKPLTASELGANVTDEILRALNALRRLSGPRSAIDGDLDRFATRFVARYGHRRVPLLEALDADLGIGFDDPDSLHDAEPLIKNIFGASRAKEAAWRGDDTALLRLLFNALHDGKREILLTNADLESLQIASTPPPPDSFHFFGTLLAGSCEAVNRGEYRLIVKSFSGPGGANLLGRFCHGDASLQQHVRDMHQKEAALDPDAHYAEIVHTPPRERFGNFICRPVLREWEIPYLGRPGIATSRQIGVSDLFVSVADGVVQLHSSSSGRRVFPRLATAHAFTSPFNVPVYRFLCSLQHTGVRAFFAWTWGPMQNLPFLPRVVYGRSILSPMSWTHSNQQLPNLALSGADRWRAVDSWRTHWQIPRFILANELCIDLENDLSIDALAKISRDLRTLAFSECLEVQEGTRCIRGPDGAFTNELIVPFVRTNGRKTSSSQAWSNVVPERFPPASEWLYAEIFTGFASADAVLRELVAPLVRDWQRTGEITRWFFIRYNDPDHHLRVRFQGDPGVLMTTVAVKLRDCLQRWMDRGVIWHVGLETYERETDRYGGTLGIALAEELFEIDSEATLELLERVSDDDLPEVRWRYALAGADRILSDFDVARTARLEFFKRAADSLKSEYQGFEKALGRRISARFRDKLRALVPLYSIEHTSSDSTTELIRSLLDGRSERLRPLAQRIQAGRSSGAIVAPLGQLLSAYVHMHVNRVLRLAQRKQELVLYDLATRLYAALNAQERAKEP
jgi:thiopeptide-type bacteriocin biosynthesis protein